MSPTSAGADGNSSFAADGLEALYHCILPPASVAARAALQPLCYSWYGARGWWGRGGVGIEQQMQTGQHPLHALLWVSAISHHHSAQPPYVSLSFWLFPYLLAPSWALGKGTGLTDLGNHSCGHGGLCWSLSWELSLPFTGSVLAKAADPLRVFSSNCLPAGGNESTALLALAPFCSSPDPG